VGWQIWGCGELRVGGAIDAMECDLTVLGIAESAPVDAQSHLRHGFVQGIGKIEAARVKGKRKEDV
jgi:hypothetical protein